MRQQGGEENQWATCEEFDARRILFAAGELDPAEVGEVSEHLQHCESCSEAMRRDSELLRIVSEQHAEPDAALLATCRANLVDALDREEEGGWVRRALGSFLADFVAFAEAGVQRSDAACGWIFGGVVWAKAFEEPDTSESGAIGDVDGVERN